MNMSLDHARLLLGKACEDEYVLERLVDDAQAPDAVIGFHSQQATEKLLKAALTSRGIPYGRTHDLDHLLDLLRDSEIPEPPDAAELAALSPYAVEFRYGRLPPEAGTTPTLDRTWARDCVRRTRAWAESLIRA